MASYNLSVFALLMTITIFLSPSESIQLPFGLGPIFQPGSTTGSDSYPIGFTLRHVFHHGTEQYPDLHKRLDVPSTFHTSGAGGAAFKLSSVTRTVTRMVDRDPDTMESYLAWARKAGTKAADAAAADFDWIHEQIPTPNVTDRETLVAMSKMTANAYVSIPDTDNWLDVGGPYNESSGFGWEASGIRGHIFADETNSTVVISIKGTSAALFDSDGDTSPSDKTNDNLLFSCCCARISYMWKTVCDCYDSTYTCKQDCVEDALYSEDRYYRGLLDIYRNTTSLYPGANIWLAGHSLGGSMAALLGRTYALPTIAVEAPPERLAAHRLHLPFPPIPTEDEMIWHIGNTADPIFMGVCNGPSSICWMGGYAMETQCHSGLSCIYDTVNDLSWRLSTSAHRIRAVIEMMEAYNSTPSCIPTTECVDCFDWEFI
ncbi:Alpha/Beta hydrolase protein [Lipomyces oligophaga]|uniref:Alpha/Beta hydrolase protein n=1 Tax=Lipomyces oligophaga TaxID=45792 RepID=UPI0034CE2C33